MLARKAVWIVAQYPEVQTLLARSLASILAICPYTYQNVLQLSTWLCIRRCTYMYKCIRRRLCTCIAYVFMYGIGIPEYTHRCEWGLANSQFEPLDSKGCAFLAHVVGLTGQGQPTWISGSVYAEPLLLHVFRKASTSHSRSRTDFG